MHTGFGADPEHILERAERMLAELSAETHTTSFRTPMEVVNRAGGITAILYPDNRRGVEPPWPSLSRMLVGRGFQPGQMVVIGARPSMGKTALACQIADHAATHGKGVAFFTLEMSDQSILFRMAAARAEVDGLRVTQGWARDSEIRALSEAFADPPMKHNADCGSMTPPAVRFRRCALRSAEAPRSASLSTWWWSRLPAAR